MNRVVYLKLNQQAMQVYLRDLNGLAMRDLPPE